METYDLALESFKKKQYSLALKSFLEYLGTFQHTDDPYSIIDLFRNPTFKISVRKVEHIIHNKKITQEVLDWIKQNSTSNLYCYFYEMCIELLLPVDNTKEVLEKLENFQHHPIAMCIIGKIYLEKFDSDETDEALREKAVFNLTKASLYGYVRPVLFLARMYSVMGDIEKQREMLRLGVELGDSELCDELAMDYMATGFYDDAIKYFLLELEMFEPSEYVFYNLGRCYHGKDSLEEVVAWYTKALELFTKKNYKQDVKIVEQALAELKDLQVAMKIIDVTNVSVNIDYSDPSFYQEYTDPYDFSDIGTNADVQQAPAHDYLQELD